MANSLTPLTSLPPSMPRIQAVGAERSERLSTTTAEGSTSSSHSRRQSRAKRWPNRRHSPSRVQRAKVLCRVVKGTPESQPAVRHCRPPKVRVQISPMRRRRRVKSGLRPRRCTPTGSVRARASKYNLCSRTDDGVLSRSFQDGQHRYGAAEELESAAVSGHVLVMAGVRAEDVAEFIVSATEPGG